jgi:hypothetical protein
MSSFSEEFQRLVRAEVTESTGDRDEGCEELKMRTYESQASKVSDPLGLRAVTPAALGLRVPAPTVCTVAVTLAGAAGCGHHPLLTKLRIIITAKC